MDTKAHKKTERAQKRQFIDTKAHKKTEKTQKRQKQTDGSFLQGPQEDRKSTEETETKQTNLR